MRVSPVGSIMMDEIDILGKRVHDKVIGHASKLEVELDDLYLYEQEKSKLALRDVVF